MSFVQDNRNLGNFQGSKFLTNYLTFKVLIKMVDL
jgi:hypothetical protein